MRSTVKTSRSAFYALCLGLVLVLVIPSFMRGMFFREDFLRCFSGIAVLGITFGILSFMQGRSILQRRADLALLVVTSLYLVTILWAKSRISAIDGALKYGSYLLVFLISQRVSSEEDGSSWIRDGLIFSGLIASLVGFFAAMGMISYRDAVSAGRLAGSFQYPNSLAAYAMFVSFIVLFSWYRAERKPIRLVYSLAEYVLLSVVVLSYSRTTWILFAGFLVVYFVVLPGWSRAGLAWRLLLAAAPVVAVNVPLSGAIAKANAAGVKKYFVLGAAICAALELLRPYATEAVSRLFPGQPESSGKKAAATTTAAARNARGRLWSLVCTLALVAVIVVVVSVPKARSAVAKIVPPTVVARFKSITLKDPSLLARLYATRDAFRIAKDDPFGTGGGGWNALYHRYQKALYYFTETHNNFAQVLVETGFLGLLGYLAFWVLIGYDAIGTALKKRSVSRPSTADGWLLCEIVSLGVGIASLVSHSALDFDLSIPAIASALFAAAGSLSALTAPRIDRDPAVSSKLKPQKAGGSSRRTISLVQVGGLVVLCLAILIPSQRYYRGMVLGSMGATALVQEDTGKARNLLTSAAKNDPYNAAYILDLAQTYVDEYSARSSETAKQAVEQYVSAARKVDPLNLQYLVKESQLLSAVESYDKAIEVAADVVNSMPIDGSVYRYLAETARLGVISHVNAAMRDKQVTPDSPHVLAAKQAMSAIEALPQRLAQAKASVSGVEYRQPDQALVVTPSISLALGQASFLKGDAVKALSDLSLAAKDPKMSAEANAWLDALSQAAKVTVPLPPGYPHSDDQVRAIAGFFGLLR